MVPPPSHKHNRSHVPKSTRVLKIVYEDLDATDSSSDEEKENHDEQRKRVLLVPFPPVSNDTDCVDETMNTSCAKTQTTLLKKQSSRKYKGVRLRKSGRWAAEIRNPIKHIREWLGTFDTQEEASQAYEARKLELEAMSKGSCYEERNNSFNNDVTIETMVAYLNGSKTDDTTNISSSLLQLQMTNCVSNLIESGNISMDEPFLESIETNSLEDEFNFDDFGADDEISLKFRS